MARLQRPLQLFYFFCDFSEVDNCSGEFLSGGKGVKDLTRHKGDFQVGTPIDSIFCVFCGILVIANPTLVAGLSGARQCVRATNI